MTTAVHSPFRQQQTIDLGQRVFRKQVLPVGSIDYKGRRITFDRRYLADLAASFRAGAFDQVPFVLADADNRHTMDPERYRGEVKGLELAADGLYAIVETTADGAKVLRDNPRLGVSARIVEDLTRADGKRYPRAIQHVLGTTDPRVTGMKPWEAVELSHDIDRVVDLTAATFEDEEQNMPPENKTEEAQPFSPDEMARLRSILEQGGPTSGAPTDTDPELTDEDIEQLLAEAAEEPEGEPATAALTADDRAALDLANATAEQATARVSGLEAELARQRFDAEAERLLAEGVRPALIELARPLLSQPQPAVIELANDQKVDASDIVRRMLDEDKGTIDLSGELGYQTKPDEGAQATALADEFHKTYGGI